MSATACILLLVAVFCAVTEADKLNNTTRPRPKEHVADNDHHNMKKPEGDVGKSPFAKGQTNQEVPRPLPAPSRRDDDRGGHTRYTRFARPGSSVELYLADWPGTDSRKRALDSDAQLWTHRVCWVLSSDFKEPSHIVLLARTLAYISDYLCIEFYNATTEYDPNNPDWGKASGCTNFILIMNGTLCDSSVGAGSNPVKTSMCNTFPIALHEMLHALSCAHVHQAFNSYAFLTMQNDNIKSEYTYAYQRSPYVKAGIFNQWSLLMYSTSEFGRNGDPTLEPTMKDLLNPAFDVVSDYVVFYELNKAYNCANVSCGGEKVDCWPGYYAKIKGVCRCVCPPDRDSAANCKRFIDGPNTQFTWPTDVTVIAGGVDNSCPSGMSPTAWVTICGNVTVRQDNCPQNIPTSDKIAYLPLCSRTNSPNKDMYSWFQGGDYCFVKPKTLTCGGAFNLYSLTFTSTCPVQTNGSYGDITITGGNKTVINLCCKSEATNMMIELPNDKPFRLFARFSCPFVQGMRGYYYMMAVGVADGKVSGGPACMDTFILYYGFFMGVCYLAPPMYGCSVNATLDIYLNNMTFTTPGFPTARIPNKRCFYCFNSQIAAQYKVTFNLVDLEANDMLMVSRYNIWVQKTRIDNTNPPKELISIGNHLCLEWWSGINNATNAGVNFTVQIILAGEYDYNYTTNGADYLGNANITEYGEPCLPWKDTLGCFDSPYDPIDGLVGYYDGNKCRNPGGALLRPWCYVYRNGSNCIKHYSHNCNIQQRLDTLAAPACADAIRSNPSFCTTAIQRYSCLKSCNLSTGCLNSPAGFIPYGRRWFRYSVTRKSRADAESECQSFGPRCSLFQLRNVNDHQFLRLQINLNRSPYHTWISGRLDATGKYYIFTGTTTKITYNNISADAGGKSPDYPCLTAYKEGSSDGRNGAMYTEKCDDNSLLLSFACQCENTAMCGPPTLPSDGETTDPPQAFYYDGARVAVRCKSYTAEATPKYIMCKDGAWTQITSACPACPNGWEEHDGRCVMFNSQKLTVIDAENFCRSQGKNGTLFQIRSAANKAFFTYMRNKYGRACCDICLISGRYRDGSLYFTDTNIKIQYDSGDGPTGCRQDDYMYKYYVGDDPSDTGAVECYDSTTYTMRSICQMDRLSGEMRDMYPLCQAELASNPRLCELVSAQSACKVTCSRSSDAAKCTVPSSGAGCVRTSPEDTLTPGQNATFACKAGYFYQSGDTARACGANGKMLGSDLVCTSNPAKIDVGMDQVKNKLGSLYSKNLILLNYSRLRVPFAGRISVVYCYTSNNKSFTFSVFRKSGSIFTYVGSVEVSCPQNIVCGYYLPEASKIPVKKDDVVAVYAREANILHMTDCTGWQDQSRQMPYLVTDDITKATFNSTTPTICAGPSIGYQVTA